jgi:glucose-1-phosphate adenylyltransferase
MPTRPATKAKTTKRAKGMLPAALETPAIAHPAPGGSRFVSTLVRETYGIVLAGGRGTRLYQLTEWDAKPAVPFGGKFKIIDFALSNCVNSGVRRIGVAVQYKSQSLIRHLQRGWNFLDGRFGEFVDTLPAQQKIKGDHWYRGTADAVLQNVDVLRSDGCKYVLILSGDHIYKMDYGRLLADHVLSKADATVACIDVPIEDAREFGVVNVGQNNRIVRLDEKPAKPQHMPGRPDRAFVNMGIYVFNAAFLIEQLLRDTDERRSSHDFAKDVLPHAIARYRVNAHSFADSAVGINKGVPYWRDVGTVDAYYEANMELVKLNPELDLYDAAWPIWTYQEQLPPAKFLFDEEDRRGMALASMVSGGCRISGACVKRSLLFSRVEVEPHALVEDTVVLPGVTIGPGAVVKRAIVDSHCVIPEGMQIGVDLKADKRNRFHVTSKGVTLVTPEMLGQRVHQVR